MTDRKIKGPVSVVAASLNRKLGPGVAATYLAQATCPDSCALRGAGCYAETGRIGLTTAQRNDQSAGWEYLDILRAEAAGIDALPRGGMLRVHVVGDVRDAAGAAIIGAAMARFDRRGGRSWTYTHAWREIPRAAWGPVSVLASCESLADARAAQAAGYAVALVVGAHDGPRLHLEGGLRLLPCIEQTTGRTCRECSLCTRGEYLERSGTVITFAAHVMYKRRVRELVESRGEA